ncbi:hypothetical protein [Paracoccus sp. ME4]|uniref:hypothetical protein n=1 Tax=Paracoccus sp. ME4 TaxID=3138066 RepID=UPI00398A9F60
MFNAGFHIYTRRKYFANIIGRRTSAFLLVLLVTAAWIDRPASRESEASPSLTAMPVPVIEPAAVISPVIASLMPEPAAAKQLPEVSPEALAELDYNGTDPLEIKKSKALVYAEIAKDGNTRREVNRKWLYTDALVAPDQIRRDKPLPSCRIGGGAGGERRLQSGRACART